MTLPQVGLFGRFVRLEPLSREHLPGLVAAGLDPGLWQWTVSKIRDPEDMRRYVEAALADAARGASLPFATVLVATGQVIGSTRFGNIALEHRRLEIGWTWLARAYQRTAANTESKLLMLTHAFEHLGCQRVEFKTNVLNTRSRQAILRLGATEEGIFRRHMIADDGSVRDTVWFSILSDEWPAVRERLRAKLDG
jgi:RimJ/RimL family protein N-acetyltransferase